MNGTQNKSEHDRFKNGYQAGNLSARMDNIEQMAENLHKAQIRLFGKIDELIPAVAELKVKASLWGAFGGGLAALITIGIALAIKFL